MLNFREWLRESEEKKEGKESYKDFFQGKLDKYKVKSPSELSDEDKSKFFDEIDSEWEDEKEDPEDGDINESKDLNYGSVIQFIVQNLKDPKSKESLDVLSYLGKNLK